MYSTILLIVLNFCLVFCAIANQTAQYPGKCEEPTIFECKNFKVAEDARLIKRSLQYTYNAEITLQLLLNRANSQRLEIDKYLATNYDLNLNVELDALFPPFTYTGKLLKALVSEPMSFLAISLFNAIDGPGTNEDVLIEILCSRKTNEDIDRLKKAFRKNFDQSLEERIYDDTSGDFMNLLMDILHGARKSESTPIDDHTTKKLINLIATSKGQNHLFESSIATIFSRESFKQLYHVVANFSKIAGQTIKQSIEEISRSPDYIKAILAIADSVTNLPRYYATRLYNAMEGLGTDNEALIRIIAIRSEIDMGCIKREFEELYGATLKSWIQKPTIGITEPISLKTDSEFIIDAVNKQNARGLSNFLLDHNNTQRQELRDYLLENYAFNVFDKFSFLESESCDLHNLINYIMLNPYEHLAHHLRQALIGIATNTETVNEILCSRRTNDELTEIKKAYENRYASTLERDISEDIKGSYRDFLLELLEANRSSNAASKTRTEKLVNLLDVFELTGSEIILNKINAAFATESYEQLNHAFLEYLLVKRKNTADILDLLSSGHRAAMEVFIQTMRNEHEFYAQRLYEALDGIGTDDDKLMRILVGRAEIDLGCIKDAYRESYGETLPNAVMDDTSGIYRIALLKLLKG